MGNSKGNTNSQGGWTLVELLVVCIIIFTVAGFAFMSRGRANEQLQRLNTARELKVAFERARFDSVKRRATGSASPARVTVTAGSFTLRTYTTDINGVETASDVVTTVPAGIVIERYDGTTLTSFPVDFNMRGETASSPAPQFRVCNNGCESPTNANSTIVLVTPTGTINFLSGDSSLPTFGVPNINGIPTSTGINYDTIVP